MAGFFMAPLCPQHSLVPNGYVYVDGEAYALPMTRLLDFLPFGL
jgi:hypothetical protein